jgi:hypothetical protein
MSKVEKKLRQDTNVKTEEDAFGSAIADIEDQLIRRRDEIFKVSTKGCTTDDINTRDPSKSKFKERVTNLRNQFKESGKTFQDWQSIVSEKYENLRKITVKCYPEAWPS